MQVLGFVIIALFAFMTLIGTYQIVTRYFFNRPSTVSEELLTYAFTWMALLASAYVFGKYFFLAAITPCFCTSAAGRDGMNVSFM